MAKVYRIAGAFDTETTNYGDPLSGVIAFPVLYQFGTLDAPILDVTPDNVKQLVKVRTFRDIEQLNIALENYANRNRHFVPVILVHNLGFDMYSLAPYFKNHAVKVLAKTARKPISFQVLDDNGEPKIVFLDTLGLFMKSLATLGQECGMPKLTGEWDYNLIRAPQTPLTESELEYAKGDLYTLIAYMGYFLRQNPDISPSQIGLRVQTKTGVVRTKRMEHVGNLKSKKLKLKVRQYWHLQNQAQKPKSDDELFTMHAATRGGFTFCARNNASKIFTADDAMRITSYDSTSQHPAQMVSHLVPEKFTPCDAKRMQIAFETACACSLERILNYWLKPFPFAFYGAFTFENLRPKLGSIFEREGIFPLADARIIGNALVYDNQASAEFKDAIGEAGYKDSCTGGVFSFGKVESAQVLTAYLTELEAWVVSRCYTWDKVTAHDGYFSTTFRKPSDMSVLAVMRFYKAKNALKDFMSSYEPGKQNDVSKIRGLYPDSFVTECEQGTASEQVLKEYYMLSKADLNSLFGIEATNECRRDFVMGSDGLELTGTDGLHNMPKSPKCNYQFGQRIVGWSRVAQVVIMELVAPYVANIICGDTDSIKLYYPAENANKIERALKRHAKALDKAKQNVCARVRYSYKAIYDDLAGIGHYVFDGSYNAFCASWNKCYLALTDSGIHATIAGVPTSRRNELYGSFDDFCNELMREGMPFEEVASLMIGYNVTVDHSLTKLNARVHPRSFGQLLHVELNDYLGKHYDVIAPRALALYPTVKTLGDTTNKANARNMAIALTNNPRVNISPVWVKWRGGKPVIER